MFDAYTSLLLNDLRKYIRYKPKCKTCVYEKLGCETTCKQYKRIPLDVQKGGYCERYIKSRC